MHEQDRFATATSSPRATNPVYVTFTVVWQIIIDNMADALHIEATGGDVGRHDDVDSSGTQALHDPLALLLCDVAVQGGRL